MMCIPFCSKKIKRISLKDIFIISLDFKTILYTVIFFQKYICFKFGISYLWNTSNGNEKNHKYTLSTSCFKVYTRNECSNALWILTDQIIFVSKLFNFVRTTGLHPFVILSDISCFKHQMEVLRATSHERLTIWPIHKWPLLMAIAGELSLSV